ncbi:hypothetical protein KR96_20335 [Ralstonia solanacearum]|nr:hypothetical protein KR96_20335 [Ralstonia solanacearum]
MRLAGLPLIDINLRRSQPINVAGLISTCTQVDFDITAVHFLPPRIVVEHFIGSRRAVKPT